MPLFCLQKYTVWFEIIIFYGTIRINRWWGEFMKRKTWLAFLLVFLLTCLFGISAQAFIGYPYLMTIEENYTYTLNLNGAGKSEKVQIKCDNSTAIWRLYINEKQVLTGKTYLPNFYDIKRKDKYVEIISYDGSTKAYTAYRYNGKALKKYVTRKSGYISWLKGSDRNRLVGDVMTGNGVYFSGYLRGFSANTGNGGRINVGIRYKVKGKKLVFDSSAYHYVYGFGTQTAKGKMVAYTKPAVRAKKKFTLVKGDKYTFSRVKFTKKYTFFQVKKSSGGKTGWIPVKTSTLRLSQQ